MERNSTLFPFPLSDEYHLRDALEAAQEELVKLLKEKGSMEWRINKLQNDIVHLAALCRVEVEDPIRQLGLTDAIRWIFSRDRDKGLTIKQVVEALRSSWNDASTYKNLHANVHTVVRRLKKAGEIKCIPEFSAGAALLAGLPVSFARTGDGDEEEYIWGGGLPPPLPDLKELIKK
jgi:hypothetical protein